MADFITKLPSEGSAKQVTSLVGAKTITAAEAFKYGSVAAIKLTFSDGTSGFIKVGANSTLEIGGTAQMGTGTQVVWQ